MAATVIEQARDLLVSTKGAHDACETAFNRNDPRLGEAVRLFKREYASLHRFCKTHPAELMSVANALTLALVNFGYQYAKWHLHVVEELEVRQLSRTPLRTPSELRHLTTTETPHKDIGRPGVDIEAQLKDELQKLTK